MYNSHVCLMFRMTSVLALQSALTLAPGLAVASHMPSTDIVQKTSKTPSDSSIRWISEVWNRTRTATADDQENPLKASNFGIVLEQVMRNGEGFLDQVGELIGQRVGWLRPTTMKELALVWLAFALALPWGLVSCLRPLLKTNSLILRMVVVGGLTGIAVWSAWRIWGDGTGAHIFVSTMLIVTPLLLGYFNSVARSVGHLEQV